MSYTPPAYTDAGGSIITGYTPPAYTDAGGDVLPVTPPVPPTPGRGLFRSATQATNAELRVDLDYVMDKLDVLEATYGPYPTYPYRLDILRSPTRATNTELRDDSDFSAFIIYWILTENAISIPVDRSRILRTTTRATNAELRIDITVMMYEVDYLVAL